MNIRVAPRVLVAVAAVLAPPLHGQDVELLGEIYGTRPPAAYFERRARDPQAFQMLRGLAATRSLDPDAGQALLRAGAPEPALALGGRAVRGTYRFPVLLGLFNDSPDPPFSPQAVQAHFFDGPNPTGTITDLYAEMSGGAVRLVGEVQDWLRARCLRPSDGTSRCKQSDVTAGVSALSGSSRLGTFLLDLLSQVQGVDWGAFDNDGADGVPNSGDDDGYVDVLAVVHPTPGAECGGSDSPNRVWSHKWNLRAAAGQDFVTTTISARPGFPGGRIRISDYTIQPVYSCDGARINEIGVFAHELGHGFGLPDLYSQSGHAGAGRWDLMGTGAWGCSTTFEPQKPCPMGAWSKAALGWVDVQVIPFGTDPGRVALDPVETSRRVIAIPSGDGSSEYYLIENRQRIGFDANLPAPGLLVWQIDPPWIDGALRTNTVNDAAGHMGVWLRQADGLNQLAKTSSFAGNRGDAGDPFPGSTRNAVFHAGSSPASFTNAGVATGVTITDIAEEGERVGFGVLLRYQSVRLRSRGDLGSTTGPLFTVDGVAVGGTEAVVRSAPYQRHTIEAVAGAPLADGVRRGFAGWGDAFGSSRIRSWSTGLEDAELEAVYGGPREMRFGATFEGGRYNVVPGKIVTTPPSPDLWFPEGTTVAFHAQAITGFEFREWGGVLQGSPNPAVLLMDQPRDATAVFDYVFAIGANLKVSVPAATPRDIVLEARNSNPPTTWTLLEGTLPDGMLFQRSGKLIGQAVATGTFPLRLAVTDALGLQASGTVTLEVTVPVFPVAALTAPFLRQPQTLTATQLRYLDRAGNDDGGYDLGDFRAYILANPNAPPTAQAVSDGPLVVPVVDFAPEEKR